MSNVEIKTASFGIPFIVFAMPATVGFLLMTIEYAVKVAVPGSKKKNESQLSR
jgi:hypothetical protein